MPALHWEPLGDQAVLARCPDEAAAFCLAQNLRAAALPWVVDVVSAYQSVAAYFDLDRIAFPEASAALKKIGEAGGLVKPSEPPRLHVIPCCYEFGLDLERVAQHLQMNVAQVIRWHTAEPYTVYAIGFCPGFPYLGYLPQPLQGVPRLPAPRLRVEPGSVGLTGKQTGIYTEARPGGWNIVGRTPKTLVNVLEGYFPLRTGDQVRFVAIGPEEYQRLASEQ